MEDLTLALITLTAFVLLFVVAIFADRAGMDASSHLAATGDGVRVPVDSDSSTPHAAVAAAATAARPTTAPTPSRGSAADVA